MSTARGVESHLEQPFGEGFDSVFTGVSLEGLVEQVEEHNLVIMGLGGDYVNLCTDLFR